MARRSTKKLSPQEVKEKKQKGMTRYSLGLAREKNGSRRDSTAAALRRLGIEGPVPPLPRITQILKEADEGLPQVLDALRSSEDEVARTFLQKYDSISPHDLKYYTWEQIAYAASLDPMRLLEVAVSSLMRHFETIGNIIAATAHPRVVRKAIQVATRYADAWRDRQNLLNARGFLPVSRGATIYNRVQVANVTPPSEGPASELPEMEEDLRDIHGLLLGADVQSKTD